MLGTSVAAAALIGGCGSDKATSKTAPSQGSGGSTAAANGGFTVKTTEYAFTPAAVTAKAGKVKFTLVNAGKIPHEFVVLKTGQAAGALKVKSGRVSEADSVGEVSETAAGTTKSATVDLAAGRYVFVCNIPGHYKDGMRGTLTVR